MGDSSFGVYLTIVPIVFLFSAVFSILLFIVVVRLRSRSARIVLGLWLIFLAFIGLISPSVSWALSLVFSPILGILGLVILISAWRLGKP